MVFRCIINACGWMWAFKKIWALPEQFNFISWQRRKNQRTWYVLPISSPTHTYIYRSEPQKRTKSKQKQINRYNCMHNIWSLFASRFFFYMRLKRWNIKHETYIYTIYIFIKCSVLSHGKKYKISGTTMTTKKKRSQETINEKKCYKETIKKTI